MPSDFAPMPTRPGWQILLDAANAVIINKPDPDNVNAFLGQIWARCEESLPDEHREEVVSAVIAASPLFHVMDWHPNITLFLDNQIGREELALRIEGTRFKIEPCVVAPGYCVTNMDLSPSAKDALTAALTRGPILVDNRQKVEAERASRN